MAITVASFRADFPQEFGNQSAYPDQAIQYWISIASLLLGTGSAGSAPPTLCSFEGSIAQNILTVGTIELGSLNLFPTLLQYENSPLNAAITGQLTGPPAGPGTYKVNFSATVALQQMAGVSNISTAGTNPFWGPTSAVASSPPTTLADFATELWVAHQLVLEKQAVAQAAAGGNPGTAIGVISSKSVNGVSVSYDISAITDNEGGYYNQTIFGLRYWRLARVRGAGPIQLGIGRAPPFLFFNNWGLTGSFNAWAGPYPGIEPGDTGFTS
jgi:hypothetical protein